MNKCTACNTEKTYKPTGFFGGAHSACPHEEEAWHQQIVAIRHEMISTASPTIRGLMQVDIDVLLETKEASSFYLCKQGQSGS